MVEAYQVPDANEVHRHVALLQFSLWHPSRPTPGVLNSRERLRAAVICGRTARGVVGTSPDGSVCSATSTTDLEPLSDHGAAARVRHLREHLPLDPLNSRLHASGRFASP